MSFVVGNREQYLEMLRMELENATREEVAEVDYETESEPEPEAEPFQTFPTSTTDDNVIKQDFDLTCGMRCLQNMYGAHIVTRQEMDDKAKFLEQEEAKIADTVEPKYNPALGDYSIEVLQAVLENKGKWTQRIAIEKIPSEYYIPVLETNPTFVGFIVAFPGHYVTVKYRNELYKCVDSLRGVATRVIDRRTLFKTREGSIFCSQDVDDVRNVIAVLAVGGSPFVEYSLLHNSWSASVPSPNKYANEIFSLLRPNLTRNMKRATSGGNEVVAWYKRWKTSRVPPSASVSDFLCTVLRERVSDEKTVIVKRNNEQAAIRCSTVEGMVKALLNMQWIIPDKHFYFQLAESLVQDEYGNELDLEAEGALEDFGLAEGSTITLITQAVSENVANVGGFYTFKCKIEGTCIGQQHNAYSVRDTQGKVHVVYKHCIETVTQ